ncbi:reverse transcriptase domain-containing protein, partial [Tanacetum coccineum]
WVEAAPLATITGKNILKFVWSNIVCRFGIPGVIISDNGKQFAENPFRDWCNELKIKQKFTSVVHPQANGQTEIGNHCTPFSRVYRSEAVLPPNIGIPTYRIQSYEENKNNADLRLNLEFLEE